MFLLDDLLDLQVMIIGGTDTSNTVLTWTISLIL